MKAREVLKLLRISRPTLHRWVKEGLIRRKKIGKRYDYFDEDVYSLLTKDIPRKTYIYARVSTSKQKKDLENQIKLLTSLCLTKGYRLHGIYADIASGMNVEGRKEFFTLLDEVMDYKVEKVVVAYKDRLSRVGFEFFAKWFSKFGTETIVVSEIGNKKLDADEVFEDISSLLHCYSMKLYSRRRKKKVEIGLSDEEQKES